MANCQQIELSFADSAISSAQGLGSGIFVLKATLHEGLDISASATIEVLATNFLNPSALRSLVHGQNARLKLTQERAAPAGQKGALSYRFLCGQIRAAKFLGQTATMHYQGQKSNLYHYELLLASPLHAMADQHHLRSFTNHCVLEVLLAVLSDYLPQKCIVLDEEKLPEALKSTQQIWVQHGESDAQFVQRLLLTHGLNYCLSHDSSSYLPSLYLSWGYPFVEEHKLFSAPSGQVLTTAQLQGSLNAQSNCLMLSNLVSGYHEDALTQSYSSASELVSAYPSLLPVMSKVNRDDVGFKLTEPYQEHVVASLEHFLALHQQAIAAEGADLALQVGNRVSLQDLGALDCTIIKTTTQAIAPLPDNISLPQALASTLAAGSGQRKRQIKVQMELKEWSDPAYSGTVDGALWQLNAPYQIVSATVCAQNGLLSPEANAAPLDTSARPGLFYALIPGAATPIVFSYQQSQLNRVGGLSQYPRPGDQVLLLQNQQGFFFLGFDQSSTASRSLWHNDVLVDEQRKAQELTSLSLEHVKSTEQLELLTSDERARLSFDCFKSADDCVAYLCYYENLDLVFTALAAHYNRPDVWLLYQNNYQAQLKAQAQAIKNARKIQVQNGGSAESSGAQSTDPQIGFAAQVSAFYANIQALLQQTSTILGFKDTTDNELLQSLQNIRANLLTEHGDVLISAAHGTAQLQGKALGLTATDDLNVHANKITISADSSINLCVGSNVIGLSQNGISIESKKWTNCAGVLDAFIYLDAINGVSVGGLSIALSSYFSSVVSDGFGASVRLTNGSLELSGINVAQSTTDLMRTIDNVTSFTINVCNELANLVTFLAAEDGSSAKNANLAFTNTLSWIIPAAGNASAFVQASIDSFNKTNKLESAQRRSLAVLIFDTVIRTIIQITNIVQLIMVANYGSVLGEQITPHFTVRDALRAILLLMKSTNLVSAMVSAFALQKVDKTASFALRGSNIAAEAENREELFVSSEQASSPVASM